MRGPEPLIFSLRETSFHKEKTLRSGCILFVPQQEKVPIIAGADI